MALAKVQEVRVTAQGGEVPEHCAGEPRKSELASGEALRITGLPVSKSDPVVVLVTLLGPVPILLMLKACPLGRP
jgi:hypothetical protein